MSTEKVTDRAIPSGTERGANAPELSGWRSMSYMVQILDGYTGGKPSWRRVFVGRRGMISKSSAEAAADELRGKYPARKYRVRKAPRRR